MESLVLTEIKDRVFTLTLNRPEKRNALSAELVTAINTALDAAISDDDVKVIVLTGSGQAFCSGADLESLKKLQTNTFDENLADSKHLMSMFLKIYHCPKPVVAKINGHALAGGCGLATLADFSIAVEDAKLSYTEVKIGFIPALVSVFLVRKIGEGKARDLLLSAKMLNAAQAVEYGLINKAVPAEDLDKTVDDLCRQLISQNSGMAMASTKALLNQIFDLSLNEGLNLAAEMNAKARASEDCQKGISAFLNKEPLQW